MSVPTILQITGAFAFRTKHCDDEDYPPGVLYLTPCMYDDSCRNYQFAPDLSPSSFPAQKLSRAHEAMANIDCCGIAPDDVCGGRMCMWEPKNPVLTKPISRLESTIGTKDFLPVPSMILLFFLRIKEITNFWKNMWMILLIRLFKEGLIQISVFVLPQVTMTAYILCAPKIIVNNIWYVVVIIISMTIVKALNLFPITREIQVCAFIMIHWPQNWM